MPPPKQPSDDGAGFDHWLLSLSRSTKNFANAPAMPVTKVIAVSSKKMSTSRPPVVTGLGICDETVSSCTVEKNNASQRLWISLQLASSSKSHISTVPMRSTMPTSTNALAARPRN